MKIIFEINEDGELKIEGSTKDSSFSAKGKVLLEQYEKDIFYGMRSYARELSRNCPTDFIYSQSSVIK